ncbi:Prenytransferase ascA [Paramyrothecium foliicola]|nr:Prenytransferase ascA [Paramyrothecium foliicola]
MSTPTPLYRVNKKATPTLGGYHDAMLPMKQPVSPKHVSHFPHLPQYEDPKVGLLSKLPIPWIPYAQLMRLDRPAGLYAFYFPYLIGLAYAASIAPELPDPALLLQFAVLLLPFNILLRGIACTWNDNVDQEFDRHVRRCRHRPIARGAVSTLQGHIFTLCQALLGNIFWGVFPNSCMGHTGVMIILFFVYALLKRITFFPQVFLGVPFAWAILFSIAALDMDPFAYRTGGTAMLIGANILWTIIYDTIYAHQDVADDKQAGVKSMALYFHHSTKLLAVILAILQGVLLSLCGVLNGFSVLYYMGTVGGVGLAMSCYIYQVDLDQPESCGTWFHTQFWTVGAGFLLGLVCEYLARGSILPLQDFHYLVGRVN